MGVIMNLKLSEIKNPTLKCFLQIFPLFVLFFIWKDFGSEIGSGFFELCNTLSKKMSPALRYAGDYILGLLTFISVWSVYVYSNFIKTERDINYSKKTKDIVLIRFWKNISHLVTICLFIYSILYLTDTSHLIDELRKSYNSRELVTSAINLMVTISLIMCISFVANIYLLVTMRTIKKEIKSK